MRLRLLLPIVALGAVLAAPALGQHDFNPQGRKKARPGMRHGGRRGGGKAERRKPDAAASIERYTAALLANPTSPFPLQKLGDLYRARDGNVDRLVADFEARAQASASGQVDAKLALAAVYLSARRRDDAVRLLESLVAAEPRLAAPRLIRAALAEREGDRATARSQYEGALPLVRESTERERVLRALMLLALDLDDLPAAVRHHDELVRLAGGSIFVKKELGAELMTRGRFSDAEVQFREVVRAAAGDGRALAPALKDLGEALARQKKLDEALRVLEQARAAAPGQGGLRNEILAILTEVYRDLGKLTELVALLEREPARDASRAATLGLLLEETGQVERALARYREAATLDPRNADVRVRLVHLLQTTGRLDEAIAEYEGLIRAAPDASEYVFELADTLVQRGERDRALALVADLERRLADRGDALASVADFYERIDEPNRALKVFERLAALPDGDPHHLADLGNRYFQAGDRAGALATWRRIVAVSPSRADGLELLGETLLEHDLLEEAIESLREAVKAAPPGKEARYQRALAGALERTGSGGGSTTPRLREALQLWQTLAARAGDDAMLARDCRNHIVALWGLLRELDAQVRPLAARLDGSPPDLEAGRLLAEVQRRLGRLVEAEAALRRVLGLAPGDGGSMLALERVLVQRRDLAGAIAVLAKLVEAEPKKAREYYQRMAQYSAEIYRDDDAVAYAARALELSPDDAEGHFRLAAMHRRRQETGKAMRELRKAIQKNPRLYRAYFELAELTLAAGQVEEADQLYRQVVRSARDEEFVTRAARSSMQIHLGRGTLAVLEHELLPVALGNPQKPVYRRMLVELYGNLTAPLVQAVAVGREPEASRARGELVAIGSRAVKPLLDALADEAGKQQRIAIEVLGYVRSKGAGPALFNFARGRAETELRVRAMNACGSLADPALLPRYAELLAPEDGSPAASASDPVAVAAAWAVARLADPKAEPLLVRLLAEGGDEIRAVAALGLGASRQAKHGAALAALARSPGVGASARTAAVFALGLLGDRAHRPTLLAVTESTDPELLFAALTALARLDAVEGSAAARPVEGAASPGIAPDLAAVLARALWSADPRLRRAALASAALLVDGGSSRETVTLPVLAGFESVDDVLDRMVPPARSTESEVRALAALSGPLAEAAGVAAATSSAAATTIGGLWLAGLLPLLSAGPRVELEPAARRALAEVSERVGRATVRSFVALATHPELTLRRLAVEVLTRRAEPEAQAALVAALDGRDPAVCRSALAALERPHGSGILEAVVQLLESRSDWSLRALAAETLGRAAIDDDGLGRRVAGALASVAEHDAMALVRESALRAAVRRDPTGAAALLRRIAANDVEPRLRELATDLERALPEGVAP